MTPNRLFFSILLTAVSLFGCAPELYEDAKYAPDASGQYASGKDSKFGIKDLSIQIQNEDGRHDVWVQVERGDLTSGEKKFYADQGISLADADYLVSSIVLGKGRKSWELARPPVGQDDRTVEYAKGDNVSRDKGKTSELYVCSEVTFIKSSQVYVDFCLLAILKTEKGSLEGRLETRVVHDDGFGNPKGKVVALVEKFGAKRDGLYFEDLFGYWTGRIDAAVEVKAILKKILPVQIIRSGEDVVAKVATDNLVFQGRNYEYEVIKRDVNEVRSESAPSFEIRFNSPYDEGNNIKGTDVITFSGQVFSQDNFAGSIFFLNHGKFSKIGTFQFQK